MARPRKEDTATMSTRVPVDVKEAFEQLCAVAGVSPSKALAQLVTKTLLDSTKALGAYPWEEE